MTPPVFLSLGFFGFTALECYSAIRVMKQGCGLQPDGRDGFGHLQLEGNETLA